MLKYINPNKTLRFTNHTIKILSVIFFIILIIGLAEALWFSPIDYVQDHSVRIMYVHVPAAWISIATFGCIGLLSIFYFVLKNKNFLLIGKSLAPSGFVFAIIAIVTGAIWGQPTWGTWWVWDARLTSMLLLGVFYLMYIVSWRIFKNIHAKYKISSIIAILGMINLPIIKFSVNWWSTLHQSSSVKLLSKSTIHQSMFLPLIIMTCAFVIFATIIFLMKYKAEVTKLKNRGLDRL